MDRLLIYRQNKPLTDKPNIKVPPQRPKSPLPAPTIFKWSFDWPQEEGYFWAYGMLYRASHEIGLYMFKVYSNSDGSFSYACNGGYFFKGLGTTGTLMWAKMQMPNNLPVPQIMSKELSPIREYNMPETGK